MEKTTEVKEVEVLGENLIINARILATYLIERDYGEDADGNRGTTRITIYETEILEITAEDNQGNYVPITEEIKEKAISNIGD